MAESWGRDNSCTDAGTYSGSNASANSCTYAGANSSSNSSANSCTYAGANSSAADFHGG